MGLLGLSSVIISEISIQKNSFTHEKLGLMDSATRYHSNRIHSEAKTEH